VVQLCESKLINTEGRYDCVQLSSGMLSRVVIHHTDDGGGKQFWNASKFLIYTTRRNIPEDNKHVFSVAVLRRRGTSFTIASNTDGQCPSGAAVPYVFTSGSKQQK
jgi:hypothetical protein